MRRRRNGGDSERRTHLVRSADSDTAQCDGTASLTGISLLDLLWRAQSSYFSFSVCSRQHNKIRICCSVSVFVPIRHRSHKKLFYVIKTSLAPPPFPTADLPSCPDKHRRPPQCLMGCIYKAVIWICSWFLIWRKKLITLQTLIQPVSQWQSAACLRIG